MNEPVVKLEDWYKMQERIYKLEKDVALLQHQAALEGHTFITYPIREEEVTLPLCPHCGGLTLLVFAAKDRVGVEPGTPIAVCKDLKCNAFVKLNFIHKKENK